MHDYEAKAAMMNVVEGYEKLAQLAEARATGRLVFPDKSQ